LAREKILSMALSRNKVALKRGGLAFNPNANTHAFTAGLCGS
jgi:hypothetical protein